MRTAPARGQGSSSSEVLRVVRPPHGGGTGEVALRRGGPVKPDVVAGGAGPCCRQTARPRGGPLSQMT
ncbi:hypothetical protein DB35_25065 [Streptomyces abyssalis]|uniref:Uncharacterized protein n=1 Tax=Streptomyces abyssalis TaxID=933944 RepID=A0A1E7JQR1_9ACTN|nr:hypothetical protein DB35_25065 [Streptomyces abyssalis]OEU90622.1 hypothetical protein AN215_08500 [Streptomyces abyssalis]OEV31372.1 hypothetical protein AN219_05865 [Streptomyces nanshensis]